MGNIGLGEYKDVYNLDFVLEFEIGKKIVF